MSKYLLSFFLFAICIFSCTEFEPASFHIGKRSVVCKAGLNNTCNAYADLIDLKDGSLLLAYSKMNSNKDDDVYGDISGKISYDSGRTWSEPFLLQENIGILNVTNPSFLRLATGELMMFFCVKNSQFENNFFYKTSRDEGLNWTALEKVNDLEGYHVINHNRVIQLKSGRIIAPVSYVSDVAHGYNLDSFRAFCYYSDDMGKTWDRSNGIIEVPNSPSLEPGIVETEGGNLLMVIRTDREKIYFAESFNSGKDWTNTSPLNLASPSSPASITKFPHSKDLLIIWNNDTRKRNPLTSAISQDDGKTWENIKTIEYNKNGGFAYTSIRFIFGKIYLTYYQEDIKSKNVDLVLNILDQETFLK